MKKIEISNTDKPKIKDLINIEHWALKNNLYAHPAYSKAIKKREKLLILFALISEAVIIVILRFIVILIT